MRNVVDIRARRPPGSLVKISQGICGPRYSPHSRRLRCWICLVVSIFLFFGTGFAVNYSIVSRVARRQLEERGHATV